MMAGGRQPRFLRWYPRLPAWELLALENPGLFGPGCGGSWGRIGSTSFPESLSKSMQFLFDRISPNRGGWCYASSQSQTFQVTFKETKRAKAGSQTPHLSVPICRAHPRLSGCAQLRSARRRGEPSSQQQDSHSGHRLWRTGRGRSRRHGQGGYCGFVRCGRPPRSRIVQTFSQGQAVYLGNGFFRLRSCPQCNWEHKDQQCDPNIDRCTFTWVSIHLPAYRPEERCCQDSPG